MNEITEEWFTKILKEMIKNKYTLVLLGKMKIVRQKDTMTTFNFSISITKSMFEDILTDEEKSVLWLEGKDE